jgi:hypothetical protein
LENPQAENFGGEIIGILLGVSLRHAEQDQETWADFPDEFVADAHLSAADALDDGAHAFLKESISYKKTTAL